MAMLHTRSMENEGSYRGMGDVGVHAGVIDSTSCSAGRDYSDLYAINDLRSGDESE
jgi:hypothetical protein